jgi:hypothetical protein
MRPATRCSAALAALALCAGLTGCGSGHSALPAPVVTTPAKPASTAVIPPTDYADPFAGARAAAAVMPAFAQTLATGVAAAARTRGDVASKAAGVRAKLTQLFVEHVYLEGLLAAAVIHQGENDEVSKAAEAAVDANAKALAKALTSLSGASAAAGTPTPTPAAPDAAATPDSTDPNAGRTSADFLTAWRAHDGDLTDFAVASKEGIHADQDELRDRLHQWSQATSHSLKAMADGNVRSSDVRYVLDKYSDALTDAMDSLGKQDGKGYDRLRKAAANAETVAAMLARGFTRDTASNGNSDDDAAALRGHQTYLLTEHVWLIDTVVMAAWTHPKTGAESSPDAAAAKLALDDNAKDLSASLADVANPRQQFTFVTGWRAYVYNLMGYVAAVRAGDTRKSDAAVAAMNTYRTTAGTFFAQITDRKLAADTVAAAMTKQIAALTGSIQAFAAALLHSDGT